MDLSIKTGRLGQDAKLLEQNGRKTIAFNLAVDRSFKDQDGNKKEVTLWVSCYRTVQTNQPGILPYLLKGSIVSVSGRENPRLYQDNQGKYAVNLDMNVDKINLIQSTKEKEQKPENQGQPQPAAVGASTDEEDDTPF